MKRSAIRVPSRRAPVAARRPGLLDALLGAALSAAVVACGGSGDAPTAAPLTAEGAHAYLEPKLALRPGHVAIVRLKPVADDVAGVEENGVSRIRLHIESAATYSLSVDADSSRVQRMVVKTDDGVEIARHERGQAESRLALAPGTHTLELHHADKGDPTAPAQTVFVRIAAAPTLRTPASTGPRARPALGADPSALAAIRAGQNCLNCDLTNADLGGLTMENGQDVSGSDFSGSDLTGATWFSYPTRVVAKQARFSTNAASGKATVLAASLALVDLSGSDFTNADLSHAMITAARFDGADLSGAIVGGPANAWQWRSTSMMGIVVSATTRFSALTGGQPYTGAFMRNVVFPAGYTGLRGHDLRYVDFGGSSFAGVDLSGANLLGANLAGVDFHGAKIAGVQPPTLFATVKPTDVSGVDFDGFDLSQADFSQTVLSNATSFVGAKLTDGAGKGIDLAGLSLPPAATLFKGLDLSDANLNGANLAQANLQGTILRNAQLHGANLDYANLEGARLNGAQLGATPGSGDPKATLIGAYMPNVDLTDADLRSADLTNAHVYGAALLLRTRFDSADFTGANLAGAAFSGSLTSAVFNNASVVNATFSGADLTNASFDSALLQGADFSAASRLVGVSLANALVATSDGSWSFNEANGAPFSYGYHATALGTMATGSSSDGIVCPNGSRGPCTASTLTPVLGGPYPPKPTCVPLPPTYDNCLPPAPP